LRKPALINEITNPMLVQTRHKRRAQFFPRNMKTPVMTRISAVISPKKMSGQIGNRLREMEETANGLLDIRVMETKLVTTLIKPKTISIQAITVTEVGRFEDVFMFKEAFIFLALPLPEETGGRGYREN
jgi:hypothetical protein